MNPKIKFTHSLLSLMIKRFFRKLLVLTIQNINHKYFIKIINTVLFLKKKKFFFGFEIQKDLYSDSKEKLKEKL